MRAVLQRVTDASVAVDAEIVGQITNGLVMLVGVGAYDTLDDVATLVRKTSELRIFPDDAGAMNRSLLDTGGAVLVISQFTLQADVKRGRRPSFTDAAEPSHASDLVDAVVSGLRDVGIEVATGTFGADMRVELTNSGPVTIVLDVVDGKVV